jgi:CRISPR system Cascade subunit CasD
MNRQFLLFQLYGPLASWGSIAVGDVRPTFDRPSKSAVLGLIGAALGLERPHREMDEERRNALEAKHRALAASFGYAVRLDRPGVFLRDYHTVQSPDGKEGRNLPTRRDEVLFEEVGTKVTHREYYSGMLATVCLWKWGGDATYSLDDIKVALEEPTFTPYLGRKACPAALPFFPEIIEATNVRAAFSKANILEELSRLYIFKKLTDNGRATYFWEGSRDEGFGAPQKEVTRRDQPVSRTRWQFSMRTEYVKRASRGGAPK